MNASNATTPRQPLNSPPPVPDPNNTISSPTGPEHKLVLSEGAYVLRDDILLGAVPPHPSEPAPTSFNVLDVKPQLPTAGPRLTIACSGSRRKPNRSRPPPTADSNNSIPTSITEDVSQSDSEGGSHPYSHLTSDSWQGPVFGDDNPALTQSVAKDSKDPFKRRKPKSNMNKSSSSFVSRVIPSDSLTKRLQEHKPEGTFAFLNVSRAMQWLDLSSPTKAEPLSKILFTKTQPLCHDFNNVTKSPQHLDVAIGFSSGDVLWYEAMSQKYARVNKNSAINPTPVSDIRWVPGSENLILAAHFDGSLVVYDKEKEDIAFTPEDNNDSVTRFSMDGRPLPRLQVKKSVQSKNQKNNPVAYWKATNQRINKFEFSPDGKYLAVVSEDGTLRVIDFFNEQLIDLYSSYYGGLTSVAWSPDGSYILTGGQDDLLSIWSHEDRCIVARCVGHHSWITSVAFDPWKCDERNYRFGSVGEDCRLLLWDFSVGMLARPRPASLRPSVSSFARVRSKGSQSQSTIKRVNSNLSSARNSVDVENDISHDIEPRANVAMLPPVLNKEVHESPLTWLAFEEDCIITACKAGHIRTWDRPVEEKSESTSSTSGYENSFQK